MTGCQKWNLTVSETKIPSTARHGNCQKVLARYTNFLLIFHQYFYNKLTVRFLMYKNTFWVCCGPLIISGKQAASWDVIRSCGSLLWKAAPSTPTIKREVVYRHCKGTLPFLASAFSHETIWWPISCDVFIQPFYLLLQDIQVSKSTVLWITGII